MGFKVLITDGLEREGIEIINAAGEAVNKKGIEADELLQVIGEYDGLIVRGRTKVTKEVFEAAKNLKLLVALVSAWITSTSRLLKTRCHRRECPNFHHHRCCRTGVRSDAGACS